jgi:hypothetical protein
MSKKTTTLDDDLWVETEIPECFKGKRVAVPQRALSRAEPELTGGDAANPAIKASRPVVAFQNAGTPASAPDRPDTKAAG